MNHDQSDLDHVNDYYQRAVKILSERLGPKHIEVATSFNNLRIVCHAIGDLDHGNDYHERAVKIWLEQLAPNHIIVATSYNKRFSRLSATSKLADCCSLLYEDF